MSDKSMADLLYPFIFGDAELTLMGSTEESTSDAPLDDLFRAQALVDAGDTESAIDLLLELVDRPDVDSRWTLQGWTALRSLDVDPGPATAKSVLGAVAEVPMGAKHDVLAGYRDQTVRYLNSSGAVVIMEDLPAGPISTILGAWFELSEEIVKFLEPWTERHLPSLPPEDARITILTPSGPHFGQGRSDLMFESPPASDFLKVATLLLHEVVEASEE